MVQVLLSAAGKWSELGEWWNSGMIHRLLKTSKCQANPTVATCASGFLEEAVYRFKIVCYFTILFLKARPGSSFPIDIVTSSDISPDSLC